MSKKWQNYGGLVVEKWWRSGGKVVDKSIVKVCNMQNINKMHQYNGG